MDKPIQKANEGRITAALTTVLANSPFFIPSSESDELRETLKLTPAEFMGAAVQFAKPHSIAPVSHYSVGAVALGVSGNLYLGTNIELDGFALNETIHAEQFAFTNARTNGESQLEAIALSAAPCGHCRQFLWEASPKLNVLLPTGEIPLKELLPEAFGPANLQITGTSFSASNKTLGLEAPDNDPLVTAALQAARSSWSPYSRCPSGVALRTFNGTVAVGAYVENAAFNPSLAPLQAAIIRLIMEGEEPSSTSEAVLVELPSSRVQHAGNFHQWAKAVVPSATARVIPAR